MATRKAKPKYGIGGGARKGKTAELTREECEAAVAAYRKAGGNISEGARLCKLNRHTYRHRVRMAERQLGIKLGKVVDGRLDAPTADVRPLPPTGKVARYILTSAQNNTHPHKAGLTALLAYRDWLASDGDTCEFIVGTFSYNIDAFGSKATKRGTAPAPGAKGNLWYAPELEPFFVDQSVQLAPALIWCGEMNILPTAANPLIGLDDYNGRASNIVPHVKHAMASVPSLPDEATKLNFSTGAITLRNYIQKRVGIMAEQKHNYGAVIVEVDDEGNWFVRQLEVDENGTVYDIGPRGYRSVKITGGTVTAIPANDPKRTFVEAIGWGDIHAAEMDIGVRELGWGPAGMIDQLHPRFQIMHDVFSMRSRGHHEMKNFHATYRKFVTGEDSVEGEMDVTADFINDAHREWCETVIVRSNHDRHLDRWLNEAKPNHDPLNARYFMHLQSQMLKAMDDGNDDFNVLEFALREKDIPESVRFLGEDESFIIAKRGRRLGIECGLHGDLGPNGSRGSTRALRKLGRPVNKFHDHTAAWQDGVVSGGACSLDFPYMKGPNAHSVTHVITFENAARQLVTFWSGKFRA